MNYITEKDIKGPKLAANESWENCGLKNLPINQSFGSSHVCAKVKSISVRVTQRIWVKMQCTFIFY